jgi:hypothetical protein
MGGLDDWRYGLPLKSFCRSKTPTRRKVVGVSFCGRAFAGRQTLRKKNLPGTDEFQGPRRFNT